ncbi:hypothetical protein OPW33_22930 [Vibrio europaeus]|uniref:hypothetical protein n=1 Tax=Vibrio europaeus TaxID=300876 RepID=UPI002341D2BC|nr:hypothetical protein [Vibrio europaeus]MDC5842186.1 hypothetical protein [Vibrio europaeus]
MRKIIKWLLILGSATLIALLVLFLTFFRLEETASTQHQMLGEILWISAPDGGVGFKILESKHPNYRVKILCSTPDNVCDEETFKYSGSKLDKVKPDDIASYFGEDIGLINGESMVKVDENKQ